MGWHVSNGHACKFVISLEIYFYTIYLFQMVAVKDSKVFDCLIKYLVGQMDKKIFDLSGRPINDSSSGNPLRPPLRLFLSKTFLSASRFTCRRFPKKAFFLRVASHHLEHWRGRFRRRCILLRRQNVRHLCQGVRTAPRSSQKCKFNGITEYGALRIQLHCYSSPWI